MAKSQKLLVESESLCKYALKWLVDITAVEVKTYTDRVVWTRKGATFTNKMANQPYVCDLDAPGVLTAGGILIIFKIGEFDFVAFTVEIKDTGAVVRYSFSATEYDESFSLLEETLDRQVTEWARATSKK